MSSFFLMIYVFLLAFMSHDKKLPTLSEAVVTIAQPSMIMPMAGCAVPVRLNRLGDRTLETWYAEYNRQYFHGSLPVSPIVRWAPIMHRGNLGESYWHQRLPIIQIDTHLKPMEVYAKLTLLHEMEHGDQETHGHDSTYHGPNFQAGMLSLAQQGALEQLW